VVRPADEEEVLDVVAAEQDQLTLLVEVVNVDDAEARLARATARARQRRAASGEAPQNQREQRQQHENNGERDGVMDRRRSFYAELGQHERSLGWGTRVGVG